MAFNHVSNCSCPVGNCDCGVDSKKEAIKTRIRAKMSELYPKGLVLREDGFTIEVLRLDWAKSVEFARGATWTYIGELDENLTYFVAKEKIFILYGFMARESVPEYLKSELMTEFIRVLSDISAISNMRHSLVEAIKPLFSRMTYDI